VNYLADELQGIDLEIFMRAALDEAQAAGQAGEYPIGAVVVIDGEIISRGRARHNENRSQLSHAELNAMLAGGERLWTDYKRAMLVTTAEPCPLCLGAAVMADIPHIIFGLHDEIVKSELTLEHNPYVRRHIKSYYGGVLADEVARLMEQYTPRELKYMQTGDYQYR
jgi:tRNA(adenine34) deaminase